MDSEKLKLQIGSNIASYRKRAGLTQAGLAERINYSDKAVSKWERAESMPDISVLVKIAEIFGISLDALVLGSASEKTEETPAEPETAEESAAEEPVPAPAPSPYAKHNHRFSRR